MIETIREKQVRILHEMAESIALEMLALHFKARDGKLPEDWDGIELRQLVADTIADRFTVKMPRERMREYKNYRAAYNL